MHRRTVLRMGAFASAFLLAGCADRSTAGSPTETTGLPETARTTEPAGGSPDSTTTGTGTEDGGTTSAQEAYPDYNWGMLENPTVRTTTTIEMSEARRFEPTVARVPTGARVTWVNPTSFPHTVTIPKLGVDRTVGRGGETSLPMEHPGVFGYVCRFHPPDMLGRLIVADDVTTTG